LAADLGNAAAQNSFGVCLERGIGVKSNLALAARYYRRSAAQGNSDGANNFGFCLERGRGVNENIEAAAECYAFAAECGHPEGELNYRRCLRILGRFESDRSSRVSNQSQSDHFLTKLFLDCLNDSEAIDRAHPETIASIQRLNDSIAPRTNGPGQSAVFVTETALTKVVKLVENSDGNWEIVKSAVDPREVDILKCLNHPLIIKSHKNSAGSIITEFAPNGSLADHLPSSKGADLCRLRGPTRIAMIIAGIAVAMNFVHARRIVHRGLNPAHIFLDWDWTVRIGGFGQSTFFDDLPVKIQQNQIWPSWDSWQNIFTNNPSPKLWQNQTWPKGNSYFVAPECYDDEGSTESDVFSFGLILYEVIVGQSAFPPEMKPERLAKLIVFKDFRPQIPDFVPEIVKELIEDCWATNPAHRPTFDVIVFRLEQMQFKLFEGVKSTKVAAFVNKIEEWESTLN
jgi:hypothetical protein